MTRAGDDEGLETMIRQGGMVGADRAIVEILGQEYGGGDYPRMIVATRLWDALRRCGVLKGRLMSDQPEQNPTLSLRQRVWDAIRSEPTIRVTPEWGPWVYHWDDGTVRVSGQSHLPAVARVLAAAGIAHQVGEWEIVCHAG